MLTIRPRKQYLLRVPCFLLLISFTLFALCFLNLCYFHPLLLSLLHLRLSHPTHQFLLSSFPPHILLPILTLSPFLSFIYLTLHPSPFTVRTFLHLPYQPQSFLQLFFSFLYLSPSSCYLHTIHSFLSSLPPSDSDSIFIFLSFTFLWSCLVIPFQTLQLVNSSDKKQLSMSRKPPARGHT